MFLPVKHEPGVHGEEPGTYVYIEKRGKVRVFTSSARWGFPVGEETDSAYTIEELENPNYFKEVAL
jgi:hypothetical protein